MTVLAINVIALQKHPGLAQPVGFLSSQQHAGTDPVVTDFDKQAKSVPQQIGEPVDHHGNETDAQLAALAGTNRQYVADARKIRDEAPDKFEQIERGQKTITQAKRELREEKRERKRRANARKVKSNATELANAGVFATIVVDPPWDWSDENAGRTLDPRRAGPPSGV